MIRIGEISDAFEWIENSFPKLLETNEVQHYKNPNQGLDYDLVLENDKKYIIVSIQDMVFTRLEKPTTFMKIYKYIYDAFQPQERPSYLVSSKEFHDYLYSNCTNKFPKFDFKIREFQSYTFWLMCRYCMVTDIVNVRLQITLNFLSKPLDESMQNQIFVMFRYFLNWTNLFCSRYIIESILLINKYFPPVITNEICLYL